MNGAGCMGFQVDPPVLDKVAGLLNRNRAAVPDMQAYITKYLEKGTAEQISGQGLLSWFTYDHDGQVERADHRLHWVSGVWHSGAANFTASAASYRSVDVETAARMDAQLQRLGERPKIDPDPSHWDYSSRVAAGFTDVMNPHGAVSIPPNDDISSLEPKAAEITKWIGDLNDLVSMNAWVRFAIKEIYGRDPIQEVIQLFSGDWTVFAHYAAAWLHVGRSVDAMRHNIAYTDDALAPHWEGNAADAALTWLQQLDAAMGAEVSFYDDYLFGVCKAYIDVAYYGYENLNYLVGELLDFILESVTALLGVVTDGLSTVAAAIIALCDAIMFIVDFFRQIYYAGKSVAALVDMPDEPPLTIADLLLPDPDPNHSNCISVPTTK
ncbi:hypothetical protein [Dactylosporangium salmoneum]|uniref:Uncharacterized protein n=1 Tax=Dactylosporangium salmoneum TaxID=53361 RepID=A0ABP5T5J0_9ACTN